MLRRVAVIAAALVVCLVVVIVGALAWITLFPGSLKGPIERIASSTLGVPVRIEGPLRLGLGRIVNVGPTTFISRLRAGPRSETSSRSPVSTSASTFWRICATGRFT